MQVLPNIGDIGYVTNGTNSQNEAPMAVVLQTEQGTPCWFFEIGDKMNVKIAHLHPTKLKNGIIHVDLKTSGWVATTKFERTIVNDPNRSTELTASLADARNEQVWKELAMQEARVCNMSVFGFDLVIVCLFVVLVLFLISFSRKLF